MSKVFWSIVIIVWACLWYIGLITHGAAFFLGVIVGVVFGLDHADERQRSDAKDL